MDIFIEYMLVVTVIMVITFSTVLFVMVRKHEEKITWKDNIIRDLREENLQLIAKLRGYLIDFEYMNITVIKEKPWRRIYVDLVDIFDEPYAIPYPAPMMHGIYYKILPEWKIYINDRYYDSSSELENKVKQE